MAKRAIDLKVLPGQPTDGSGKVCIHLFVCDENGPFVEPCVMHVEESRLVSRPTRGRLACDPKRTVAPVTRGGATSVTPRSDDPRAVTCLKCKASEAYKELMEKMEV